MPFDPARLDAVVFDIGGVFTVRHPEPVGDALRGAGFDVPWAAQAYRRAHFDAVRALTDLVGAARRVSEYDEASRRHVERAYVTSLGVPPDAADAAVDALVAGAAALTAAALWRLVLEENVAGFRRVAASGMPVAVVSNNDGTAAAQLRGFGIAQVGPGPCTEVVTVVDSRLVGVVKPDPAIFTPALAALGTAPARTLYVGDTVHADVLGASAAGMPVVQVDPYDLHAGFDHARVADVGVLADLLGA